MDQQSEEEDSGSRDGRESRGCTRCTQALNSSIMTKAPESVQLVEDLMQEVDKKWP